MSSNFEKTAVWMKTQNVPKDHDQNKNSVYTEKCENGQTCAFEPVSRNTAAAAPAPEIGLSGIKKGSRFQLACCVIMTWFERNCR